MHRWSGQVAVVTGASSGIGLATVKALLNEGMIVVGFARRKAKMECEMKGVKNANNFHARECDISNGKSITENFQWVQNKFGKLNVLINNAGTAPLSRFEDTDVAELDKVIQVNVLGLMHCTKEAIPLMKKTGTEAHIINVSSILGHFIPDIEGFNIYPASKFAVRALGKTLAVELKSTKIRISSVSPGLVKTEISKVVWEKSSAIPALEAEDLANAMIYILGAPPHVEIADIILSPKAVIA